MPHWPSNFRHDLRKPEVNGTWEDLANYYNMCKFGILGDIGIDMSETICSKRVTVQTKM